MKAISFSTDWSNQNQENRLLESRCTSLAELHRCQRLAKSSLFLKLETSRNHIRKLLTGDGAMKISAVLPDTTSRVMFEKIFSVMGKIQAYSKASFLDIEEIDEFKNLASLPFLSITPEFHLLCVHVRNFMDDHAFWGLISEQSIEALHARINKDERRLASMRGRRNILRKIIECSFVRNVLFDMEITFEGVENFLE
uniref:Uncharacterized protein n=1 Tax=Ditylenchus dipsaci TaxID=166011 RepID=A0A915CU53_9BILA